MSRNEIFTEEAECQTVLQCYPLILEEDDEAVVQSTQICQTLISFNPKDSNTKLFPLLSYTDPQAIKIGAIREIRIRKRKKLQFTLPNDYEEASQNEIEETQKLYEECEGEDEDYENEDENECYEDGYESNADSNEEDKTQKVTNYLTETTANEAIAINKITESYVVVEAEIVTEPELIESQPISPYETINTKYNSTNSANSSKYRRLTDQDSDLSDQINESHLTLESSYKILKSNMADEETQTMLMVSPHMLLENERAVVSCDLSIQTSVTCPPECSLQEIIPKLKSYLAHDNNKTTKSVGDTSANTSILDILRNLIEDIEISHSRMFDPNFIPPQLPPELAQIDKHPSDQLEEIEENTTNEEAEELKEVIDLTKSAKEDCVNIKEKEESIMNFIARIDETSVDQATTIVPNGKEIMGTTIRSEEIEEDNNDLESCWCKFPGFKINIVINNILEELCPQLNSLNIDPNQLQTCLELSISSADIKKCICLNLQNLNADPNPSIQTQTEIPHHSRALLSKATQNEQQIQEIRSQPALATNNKQDTFKVSENKTIKKHQCAANLSRLPNEIEENNDNETTSILKKKHICAANLARMTIEDREDTQKRPEVTKGNEIPKKIQNISSSLTNDEQPLQSGTTKEENEDIQIGKSCKCTDLKKSSTKENENNMAVQNENKNTGNSTNSKSKTQVTIYVEPTRKNDEVDKFEMPKEITSCKFNKLNFHLNIVPVESKNKTNQLSCLCSKAEKDIQQIRIEKDKTICKCNQSRMIPINTNTTKQIIDVSPVKLIVSTKESTPGLTKDDATFEENVPTNENEVSHSNPKENFLFNSFGLNNYVEPYLDDLLEDVSGVPCVENIPQEEKNKNGLVFNTMQTENFIEPYITEACSSSRDHAEVQTDLALGSRILSESLYSEDDYETCSEGPNSCRDKRGVCTDIPWSFVTLPPKGTVQITNVGKQNSVPGEESRSEENRIVLKEVHPASKKKISLVFGSNKTEVEPYSEALVREISSKDKPDSPCSSKTNIPWQQLTLPKDLKITKMPKQINFPKNNSVSSTCQSKSKTEIQQLFRTHRLFDVNQNNPPPIPESASYFMSNGSTSTVNILPSNASSYVSSWFPPVLDQNNSSLLAQKKNSQAFYTKDKSNNNVKGGKVVFDINSNESVPNKYAKSEISYKYVNSKTFPVGSDVKLALSESLPFLKCACKSTISYKSKQGIIAPSKEKICEPPCAMSNTSENSRTSSSLTLKPDPVIQAFLACERELKPLKMALYQVQQKLQNLNMPELDCIFKKNLPHFNDLPNASFRFKSPSTIKTTIQINQNNSKSNNYLYPSFNNDSTFNPLYNNDYATVVSSNQTTYSGRSIHSQFPSQRSLHDSYTQQGESSQGIMRTRSKFERLSNRYHSQDDLHDCYSNYQCSSRYYDADEDEESNVESCVSSSSEEETICSCTRPRKTSSKIQRQRLKRKYESSTRTESTISLCPLLNAIKSILEVDNKKRRKKESGKKLTARNIENLRLHVRLRSKREKRNCTSRIN